MRFLEKTNFVRNRLSNLNTCDIDLSNEYYKQLKSILKNGDYFQMTAGLLRKSLRGINHRAEILEIGSSLGLPSIIANLLGYRNITLMSDSKQNTDDISQLAEFFWSKTEFPESRFV